MGLARRPPSFSGTSTFVTRTIPLPVRNLNPREPSVATAGDVRETHRAREGRVVTRRLRERERLVADLEGPEHVHGERGPVREAVVEPRDELHGVLRHAAADRTVAHVRVRREARERTREDQQSAGLDLASTEEVLLAPGRHA
ncbi:MAG: hypothetical protein ABR599_04815 [Gemmatimonadota bacterium]